MEIKIKRTGRDILLSLVLLAVLMTACVKEDLSNCTMSYTFTVRAYDNSGQQLSGREVSDVSLYVFNGRRLFVRSIQARVGESVRVEVPDDDDIHIVGWGNLGGGSENCIPPNPGDHMDLCRVNLIPQTRATVFALPPDDLFRGAVTVSKADRQGEKILPLYREVGSMAVTVRNLPDADGDYRVVVHETPSSIDFYGRLSGEKVGYRPGGALSTTGGVRQYHVAPFNLFPGEGGMRIEVYRDERLLANVSGDSGGLPIVVQKDRLTNVLIELRELVSVTVSITPWGEQQMWKEF